MDSEGRLQNVTLLKQETEERRTSAQSRLHALFARNKNKG
jgi:hypothetical protein